MAATPDTSHSSSLLRSAWKAVAIIVAVLIALAALQSLPIVLLKPLGAQAYANDSVVVYYEPGDEAGAHEVFQLVSNHIGEIDARMEYQPAAPLGIFVYKAQSSLWMRKYGLVTLLFAPTWYVGDSQFGAVKLVSPNTPVQGHTHDSILNAILHEVVHSINYHKNPRISYFWDNALATYIAGQVPPDGSVSYWNAPSLDQMHTSNEMEFGEMGGYFYSYSYAEYLDKTYGWARVIEYASGGKSYEDVFGASERAVYDGWLASLPR